VQRHYPTLAISESCPPRVVFVMARVPESFQRKVKQLSFPSVDAVEVHYIDVNGVPAVYFDTVAQIRRGVPTAAPIERPAPTLVRVEAASVRPPVRIAVEPAGVVATMPIPAQATPVPAPVVVPVIAGASDAGVHQRVSLASAMCHVIDGSARLVGDHDGGVAVAESEPEIEPVADAAPEVEPAVEVREAVAASETSHAVIEQPVGELDAPPAVEARVVEPVTEVAVEAPAAELATAVETPAPAKAEPEGDPNVKSPSAEAARAAKLAQDLGIQLPKEGALTRQWIDFLNQLAAK
jgi:hypothetical protein